ncbi:Leucine Rich repeat [Carpediemonas membranifera]|uniref:Leucine Rich repeat n=1 Tax=Carpediemonas membranifera TaxID=201153 RepID=A0A8J6DZV6_9EUKA|nr:Leucine Rich repeat [Carpediemonas membranifera]|eukprot:KAG9394179.1 Leucine Rich repeat [Carpediemonas membranifera]
MKTVTITNVRYSQSKTSISKNIFNEAVSAEILLQAPFFRGALCSGFREEHTKTVFFPSLRASGLHDVITLLLSPMSAYVPIEDVPSSVHALSAAHYMGLDGIDHVIAKYIAENLVFSPIVLVGLPEDCLALVIQYCSPIALLLVEFEVENTEFVIETLARAWRGWDRRGSSRHDLVGADLAIIAQSGSESAMNRVLLACSTLVTTFSPRPRTPLPNLALIFARCTQLTRVDLSNVDDEAVPVITQPYPTSRRTPPTVVLRGAGSSLSGSDLRPLLSLSQRSQSSDRARLPMSPARHPTQILTARRRSMPPTPRLIPQSTADPPLVIDMGIMSRALACPLASWALTTLSAVVDLDLSSCVALGDTGGSLLAMIIPNQQIRSLNVSRCGLQSKGVRMLLQAASKSRYLNELVLDHNTFSNSDPHAISNECQMLAAAVKTSRLQLLHLGDMSASRDHGAALFEALGESGLATLADLSVAGWPLTSSSATALKQSRVFRHLQRLDISGVSLISTGSDPLNIIMSAISQSDIRDLFFESMGELSVDAGRLLGALLYNTPALEQLSIAHTELSASVVRSIVKGLQPNPRIGFCAVRRLDLSWCGLRFSGASFIFSVMRMPASRLSTLVLRGNTLGPATVRAAADLVRHLRGVDYGRYQQLDLDLRDDVEGLGVVPDLPGCIHM